MRAPPTAPGRGGAHASAFAQAELAERRLRRVSPARPLDRAPALEILVRARAQRGDLAGAEEALRELRRIERAAATPLLTPARQFAEGILAAASGDHDKARLRFEDAADRFRACAVPFEAARAGIELSHTLAALGRFDAARAEASAARDLLSELGASEQARHPAEWIVGASDDPDADDRTADGGGAVESEGVHRRDQAAADGTAREPSLPQLTRREREVLREVALGLTNREVARRLYISEHTVHRHVANILRKLDVPSRTAAATRAAQAGLLEDNES